MSMSEIGFGGCVAVSRVSMWMSTWFFADWCLRKEKAR